jgi:hypothetical protein
MPRSKANGDLPQNNSYEEGIFVLCRGFSWAVAIVTGMAEKVPAVWLHHFEIASGWWIGKERNLLARTRPFLILNFKFLPNFRGNAFIPGP